MSDGFDKAGTKVSRRPIDLLRNAAGVWEIGIDEDGPIVEAIPAEKRLYFVMRHAIYAFQLADQIDPKRENPSIPNTQQKELSIGSDNPDVARILLTAAILFKQTALGASFDVKRGIELSFDLLRDIASLREKTGTLDVDLHKAANPYEALTGPRQSFQLPSIENIEAQCDAFAQKAAHVVNGLEALARFFYPQITSKWLDALIRIAKQERGDLSHFSNYLDRVRPFLMFVNDDFRNLIEHPRPERHIKIHNFRLVQSGDLKPPTMEIVRPNQPIEDYPVNQFMMSITDDLVNVCEGFLLHLCDSNIKAPGPFSFLRVIEVPPDQRRNPHIRLSYGYYNYNGQTMVPIVVG